MRVDRPNPPAADGVASRTLWLALASLLYAQVAFAHEGPQVRKIHFGAPDADSNVLVANRGLFMGKPGDWRLMCNEAVMITTSERPDIVVLPSGRMFVPTTTGLLATDDRGCNWPAIAAFSSWSVPALAQHPSDPMRLYASTYAPGETGLRQSTDGGDTWQLLQKGADTDFYRYFQIARSDPNVIYVAKLSFGAMKFEYFVSRSADGGKTWQDHPVQVNDDETDLELLAVSPTDPSLVIAKAQSESQMLNPERLLISHDGGATFESPMAIHVISEAAFSDDGKTAWLATDDGLFRSTDGAHTFARVGVADLVSCVVVQGKQLYVCGWVNGIDAGNPGIGISEDGGETYTSWMHLTDVTQPLTCAPTASTTSVCAALWIDWQREILGPTGVAVPGSAGSGAGGVGGLSYAAGVGGAVGSSAAGAGAPVSAAGAGGSARAPSASGTAGSTPAAAAPHSGCTAAGFGASHGFAAATWSAWLLIVIIRRRRRAVAR